MYVTEFTNRYKTKLPGSLKSLNRISTQAILDNLFHCQARLTSLQIWLVSEKKFIVFS